jgi:hypothetical protein
MSIAVSARISADAYRVHVATDPTRDLDQSHREIDEALARDDTPHPAVIVGSDAGALFATAVPVRPGSTREVAQAVSWPRPLPASTASAAAESARADEDLSLAAGIR